ncbi:hypothetical protein OS493_027784 [Desmophyllum pertusum]|uniref:Uncharacterized protein n=1 Tax=Desmophyllum pertusum TaxID=174260 RepID=A0A9X0CPX5_9CNID|nr:hypothetical protein OS493_027784 [Desmophyllum pertusum]
MNIPSFVGPLASALLFLLTVFGFCFYYCYFKPMRQRKKDAECKDSTGSPSFTSRSCPKRAMKKYDEESCYDYSSGFSPYSAGFCFHGGFPISNSTASYYEQNWQRPRKYQGPAVVKVTRTGNGQQCLKPKTCGEPRVDMIKDLRCHGKAGLARQLSTDSHASSRNSCHLQVIQECEEEMEENEEISEISSKKLGEGCSDGDNSTCNNTVTT